MARLKKTTEEGPLDTTNVGLSDRELIQKQQEQIDRLGKMIEATWDVNKVKDFNRRTSQPQNYSYSMGLWETEAGEKVIMSWRMTKDYVANGGKIEEQKMELVLEDDTKILIEYVDLYRKLKRTPKLEAIKIFDNEGNAYVTRKDDLWNKLLVVPTSENFEWNYEGKDLFSTLPTEYNVVLSYLDKEYTMSVKFLNV